MYSYKEVSSEWLLPQDIVHKLKSNYVRSTFLVYFNVSCVYEQLL